MLLQIDHLVTISPDLDIAVSKAEHAGFTVVRGGTHADGVTHNALIAFADGTYIELISPTRPDLEGDHRWFDRLRTGGGLVDFCLLSDSLEADIETLHAHGLDYSGPSTLGRNRPDGERIDWVLGIPPGNVGESGWPFLIEDTTPRAVRVPYETDEITHANDVTGVAGVTVLVHDLDRVRPEYEALLGTKATDVAPPLGATGRAAQLTVGTEGRQWIVLMEPMGGKLAWHAEALGQGPYAATLRTHEGNVTPHDGTPIDPPLDEGVLLLLA